VNVVLDVTYSTSKVSETIYRSCSNGVDMNNIPLGVGLPDQPLYGVYDTEQNFFYIVSCHQPLVDQAVTLLSQYRPTIVLLISDAVNWDHTLIDNSVCNRWGVTYTPDKTCVSREIEHSTETLQLIENLLKFLAINEKLITFHPHIEPLCRIWIGTELPAPALREQFATDAWFNSATAKETHNHNRMLACMHQDLDAIKSVFDLDIGLCDYQEQINGRILNLPIDQPLKKIFYEF